MQWRKRGLIFEPDKNNSWSQSHAQVPIVKQLNDAELRVYYGTRDIKNRTLISFFDVSAENPSEIIYRHPDPILPLGNTGCFDDSGVMPSDIITWQNKTYLYYVGWNTGNTSRYRTAIGLALSEDGGHSFSKIASGPIMDRTMYDPVSISCQSVLGEENCLKTWYMSYTKWEEINGITEPFYEIKYAESTDGIHWDRPNKTCIPLRDSEGGVACPTVVYENATYRMWYSTRGDGNYRQETRQSYRIGYAESTNGIDWKRKDDLCGLGLSESGWDSEMIAYPYVIRVRGKLIMFYNGNGFGKSGIGYAELINE
ncbi:MAG: hypothetical protein AB8G77_10495 [Rhodothermales bacterium]